jgi:hypothetical protein
MMFVKPFERLKVEKVSSMEPKDNRLAYQGKVEAYLKEWGSQIDEWKDKASAESQEFLEDLNTKRQAVRSKLAQL